MKILFTTPILEHPPSGGPELRIANTIKALSRVSELHVLYRAYCRSPDTDRTEAYFAELCNVYQALFDYQSSNVVRLIQRTCNRLFYRRKVRHLSEILNHIHRHEIDLIWFGYGNISYPLIKAIKTNMPNIPVVCDTDSVWSRFILRELPFAEGKRHSKIRKDGLQKEEEEKSWVELCEVTTAVSEIDADYYRSIAIESNRVHIFSNVIDIDNYQPPPIQTVSLIKPCIFLAGSFGPNSAMNMATKWIVDEVLPLIRINYPGVHFYLVGKNSDIEFGHLNGKNITVTGKVDSVLPYLCHADVAIVPLKFESGTRFKILEAGACRVPLVSTTLGAEGIFVADGKHILIADTTQEFANAIMRIFEDSSLGTTLANNCYDLIVSRYSVDKLESEALQILDYLKL